MATKTKPKPTDNAMTSLLSRLGVNYKDAPAPTPAMLAFMRGLGMNLDTADDAKERRTARVKERTTSTLADIDRGNERTKTNMLADLVRRGVLRSGEANTRYGQQAENVASKKGEALRAQAEGIDEIDIGHKTVSDSLRTGALERLIGSETEEATRAAALKAQTESYARQDDAADKAWKRTEDAEERRLQTQIDLLKKYGR